MPHAGLAPLQHVHRAQGVVTASPAATLLHTSVCASRGLPACLVSPCIAYTARPQALWCAEVSLS